MNERQRALDLALTQIEKQFGKGSIMRLGEASARLQVEVISTGALALDIALGVGGVPRGRRGCGRASPSATGFGRAGARDR